MDQREWNRRQARTAESLLKLIASLLLTMVEKGLLSREEARQLIGEAVSPLRDGLHPDKALDTLVAMFRTD